MLKKDDVSIFIDGEEKLIKEFSIHANASEISKDVLYLKVLYIDKVINKYIEQSFDLQIDKMSILSNKHLVIECKTKKDIVITKCKSGKKSNNSDKKGEK